MNNELKFDFKNITKDDVAKLAAPHLNYVTFDYTNSEGVESERNLRVFGIKYHNKSNRYPYSDIYLIYGVDVETNEAKSFRSDRIRDCILLGDNVTTLNVTQWITLLDPILKEVNVLNNTKEDNDTENHHSISDNGVYSVASNFNRCKAFDTAIEIEYIGFDESASLLLDHVINQIKTIKDDENASKWVVMNNLTNGFIDRKNDKVIRYLTLKEFLSRINK